MKIIDPQVAVEIPFSLEIDGDHVVVNSVHVSLETGKGFDVRFPAVYKDGVVTCSIHGIDRVVGIGERKIRLEAVINDKYYVPLEDTVLISAPLRVTASLDVVEVKKKPFISASLKNIPDPVSVEDAKQVSFKIEKKTVVKSSVPLRVLKGTPTKSLD